MGLRFMKLPIKETIQNLIVKFFLIFKPIVKPIFKWLLIIFLILLLLSFVIAIFEVFEERQKKETLKLLEKQLNETISEKENNIELLLQS